MKVVGYIVLALVAFFVVKSILSWLVSVLITIALVAGAISLITYFFKQKTA